MGQTVLLFHSALGLRPAVWRFADELGAAGHVVHTPDLFNGAVFDRLEDGVRRRDEIGIAALSERAASAAADVPRDVVYAGFSMGAASAEFLAVSRPGAKGLVLMHGAIPPAAIGMETWPPVPVQLHSTTADPWAPRADVDAVEAAATAAGVRCEAYWYEGEAHLFSDADGPEYDAAAARLMLERVKEFLATL
jgi:dienelactone hydrolase